MARTCLTIILAAGEGTRMKSSLPKVLHEVAGLSLLGHVMRAAQSAGGQAQAVVVGREADKVEAEALRHSEDIAICLQKERLGTAHAVLAARASIERGFDDVLVLMGDSPLISSASLMRLREALADGVDVAVLGFRSDTPEGYGRLIEKDNELIAIREQKDASPQELKIGFCNGGIMGLSGANALSVLERIENKNAKNEYYLTDCVEIARAGGLKVVAIEGAESEMLGVNDRYQLSQIEGIWQQRRREQMMRDGVTMQMPGSVCFNHDTEIGADTIIEPNVVFGAGVKVAEKAIIRAFSHLEGAVVETGVVVGPYARLRPGSHLMEGAKIGNFCEIKKTVVEKGAKVNHLSYIGDARVGENANIGAGTITCNYDGTNKHFTDIGSKTFIGSNSALVAPVVIGDGAIVGSGSVVTEDVPANALAIGRGRQINKVGHALTIRQRNLAFKAAKAAATGKK
jgi:bifunctional UDP-N-acetylglucosamine pyrophosphorylase/glucosamine-1-phosphate N-acetyltransferase